MHILVLKPTSALLPSALIVKHTIQTRRDGTGPTETASVCLFADHLLFGWSKMRIFQPPFCLFNVSPVRVIVLIRSAVNHLRTVFKLPSVGLRSCVRI